MPCKAAGTNTSLLPRHGWYHQLVLAPVTCPSISPAGAGGSGEDTERNTARVRSHSGFSLSNFTSDLIRVGGIPSQAVSCLTAYTLLKNETTRVRIGAMTKPRAENPKMCQKNFTCYLAPPWQMRDVPRSSFEVVYISSLRRMTPGLLTPRMSGKCWIWDCWHSSQLSRLRAPSARC